MTFTNSRTFPGQSSFSRIAEYDIKVGLEPAPYEAARWVSAADATELRRFEVEYHANMADDRDATPVFLARSLWELNYTMKKLPGIAFSATRERILHDEV